MRLLEHQSHKLLTAYDLAFTNAVVVSSPSAAAEEAHKIGSAVMLKAQVPFGGRLKAGAVQSAATPEESAHVADRLLGSPLRGVTVSQVSVETKISFQREFYVGIAWDTANKLPMALLGAAGGIDVEETRAQVTRRTFDPWNRPRPLPGTRNGRRSRPLRQDACRGSVHGKKKALREAGVFVADRFNDILDGLQIHEE